LLARPEMLFLDEATSALDAATEEALYQLLLKELPEAAIISIAHREVVAKFHQVRWQFVHEPRRIEEIADGKEHVRYTIHRSQIAKPAKEAISDRL
jgi:putative ATP-binding cassette transporter